MLSYARISAFCIIIFRFLWSVLYSEMYVAVGLAYVVGPKTSSSNSTARLTQATLRPGHS